MSSTETSLASSSKSRLDHGNEIHCRALGVMEGTQLSPTRDRKLALLRGTKHFTTPEINRYLRLPVSFESLEAVVSQAAMMRSDQSKKIQCNETTSNSCRRKQRRAEQTKPRKSSSQTGKGLELQRADQESTTVLANLTNVNEKVFCTRVKDLDQFIKAPSEISHFGSGSSGILQSSPIRDRAECHLDKENCLHAANSPVSGRNVSSPEKELNTSPEGPRCGRDHGCLSSSPSKRQGQSAVSRQADHVYRSKGERLRGSFDLSHRAEDALRLAKAGESSRRSSCSPRAGPLPIEDYEEDSSSSDESDSGNPHPLVFSTTEADTKFPMTLDVADLSSSTALGHPHLEEPGLNVHPPSLHQNEAECSTKAKAVICSPSVPDPEIKTEPVLAEEQDRKKVRTSSPLARQARKESSKSICPVSLEKPGLTYASMITKALGAHGNGAMTLNEIYRYINQKWPFYQIGDSSSGWQNSIRHNLSLNPSFVKRARPQGWDGKGSLWTLKSKENVPLKEDAQAIECSAETSAPPAETKEISVVKKRKIVKKPTPVLLTVAPPMIRSKSDSTLVCAIKEVDMQVNMDLTPLTPELRDFTLSSEPLEYTSLLHGNVDMPTRQQFNCTPLRSPDGRRRYHVHSLFDHTSSDLPSLTTDDIASPSSPGYDPSTTRTHKFVSGKWHLSPTRSNQEKHSRRPSLIRATTIGVPTQAQSIEWDIWFDLDASF